MGTEKDETQITQSNYTPFETGFLIESGQAALVPSFRDGGIDAFRSPFAVSK